MAVIIETLGWTSVACAAFGVPFVRIGKRMGDSEMRSRGYLFLAGSIVSLILACSMI